LRADLIMELTNQTVKPDLYTPPHPQVPSYKYLQLIDPPLPRKDWTYHTL